MESTDDPEPSVISDFTYVFEDGKITGIKREEMRRKAEEEARNAPPRVVLNPDLFLMLSRTASKEEKAQLLLGLLGEGKVEAKVADGKIVIGPK